MMKKKKDYSWITMALTLFFFAGAILTSIYIAAGSNMEGTKEVVPCRDINRNIILGVQCEEIKYVNDRDNTQSRVIVSMFLGGLLSTLILFIKGYLP